MEKLVLREEKKRRSKNLVRFNRYHDWPSRSFMTGRPSMEQENLFSLQIIIYHLSEDVLRAKPTTTFMASSPSRQLNSTVKGGREKKTNRQTKKHPWAIIDHPLIKQMRGIICSTVNPSNCARSCEFYYDSMTWSTSFWAHRVRWGSGHSALRLSSINLDFWAKSMGKCILLPVTRDVREPKRGSVESFGSS